MRDQISIRNALPNDLDAVIALDAATAVEEKPPYWREIFSHYVERKKENRLFLVAEMNDAVVGFIVGEVRAWEFGSPPCAWVFALETSPKIRERGVGQQMFEEMCRQFRQTGVKTVRTMVERDNKLTLSFFRSQGLRTGRYIELEQALD